MDLKRSWLGAKRRNNFVTRIYVLMFSLNAACCEIFCPPAVKNAAYNVTAEKYNIAAQDLGTLIATWYMGNEILTMCNFTSKECMSSGSKPKFPLTFQVFMFGNDDIQMTLLIDKLTPNLQQTFSVHWDYASASSIDSCQVAIGGPVDECSTQKPCLNGADCSDLQIGYHCDCKEGFSGMTCREGDLRLRCTPSSYRIVFNQQTNACADFNISCSVAGVASQDDIYLNLAEVSNNGSSDLSVTPSVSNNTVFFKLCITPSTRFGSYEILYKLQAPGAVSGFNLQILPELNNVTTPPGFNTPAPGVPYTFDVPEDAQPGQVIVQVNKSQSQSCSSDACIQVLDPDVSSVIGVNSLVLAVDLESQQQPVPIVFKSNMTSSSFGFFYVNGRLTSGTSITFRLTVTDGSQASASASVIFTVTDVNHPPVCKTDTIEFDLDIRQQPVKNLGAVSCSDNDSLAVFRGITYAIEGPLSKYFNISSDGVIMLCHSVQDLEPGLLTFNVTATGYSVSSDPAFVVYIPVRVNLTVPEPKCNLSVSSVPDVWEANRTAELKLECDIQGVDKLTMISWNLVDVFNISVRKQSPTVYTVTLTVKQYKPADYNVEVVASLGGPTSTASVKVAMYNRPRFKPQTYTVTISDTTPKGSKIVTVTAVTDVPGSTLTFNIRSGNNGSLFSLGNNGTLYLAQQPMSFAGSTVRLLVQVEDSISGLNDTVEVVIHISDTNQPPICANPGPVKINSNLAINSVITRITCNDSDITPEFQNLSYSITAAGQLLGVIGVRNNGEIILLKELPAGIAFLSVTVNVSDARLFTLVELNITVTVIMCPKETTEFGLIFPETPVNSVINVSCPQAYAGVVSRRCNLNQTWGSFTYNTCTRKDLANASALLADLKANASHVSPEAATAAMKSVADQLSQSLATSGRVLSGDIKQMVELLKGVGEVTELFKGASLADGTLKSFASSSDLIIGADVAMWQQAGAEEDEGAKMLQALDSITSASVRNTSFDGSPVVGEHLAIKRGISKDDVVFPDNEDVSYHNHSGWVLNSNNTAVLPKAAFASHTDSVKYSVILYKNVTEKFKVNNSLQEGEVRGKVINSDILSFSIDTNLTVLSPPLVISFPIVQTNYSEPLCGYLNTSASVSGVWATKGCTAEVFSDRIKCSCNHLTNFAVLMSPFGSSISSTDEQVLSIISVVGCGVSMLCLIITVIIYIILWKYVKCDRAVLHVNLSVCLVVAYVVFLLGVHRTDSEVGCKVVAALLHFLFLVVFFTMLCEGIEVFKSVTFVFTSDSIIRQLLLISYGVPVIIVAVSLGATQTKGYGSETTCWLSVDNGLIWAFVGPALLVLVINLIILIRVLRIMQHSNLMMVKTAQQRTKSVVRTICVLSPLLGITWVFGVLSVSKDTVVFQYLFAIFNSLQGFFIFICYCVLTPQVIDGFRAMRRKYRARSFDSNQRGVSSSFSGKYSESEVVSAKHKKHSSDFKSSFVNTNSTSMKDSSQTASSDCTNDKHPHRHKYGRRESNDSRKMSLSDSDSVFNYNGVNRYGGEIPLSYTDPHSRINSQPFVDVGYPGTFLPGHNLPVSGQALMHRGSLFSISDKNTQIC